MVKVLHGTFTFEVCWLNLKDRILQKTIHNLQVVSHQHQDYAH